jgi:hypothetical protein
LLSIALWSTLSAKIIAGSLHASKRVKVLSWVARRRDVLLERFAAAVAHEKLEPIE